MTDANIQILARRLAEHGVPSETSVSVSSAKTPTGIGHANFVNIEIGGRIFRGNDAFGTNVQHAFSRAVDSITADKVELMRLLSKKPDYLTEQEFEVIFWINKARSNPKDFAEQYLDPKSSSAEELECYAEMIEAEPMAKLLPSKAVSKAAKVWAIHAGEQGILGHEEHQPMTRRFEGVGIDLKGNSIAENLAYGINKFPLEMITDLLIDEGIEDRGHRRNILNPDFKCIGVNNQGHDSKYRWISVHNFYCQMRRGRKSIQPTNRARR